MKIAFLSHLDANLYRFRLPIMVAMAKQGNEVYAICPEGEFSGKFNELGIHEVHYAIERKSINPFTEFKALREILDKLKSVQPDILHTFTAKPNIYGAIAGRKANVPVIISTVTGLGSFYIDTSVKSRMIKKLIEGLYRFILRRTDATIFQNGVDRQYFIDQGLVPENKARLVRSSGVDSQFFSPERVDYKQSGMLKKELGIEDGKIVVLMIARAIWHKGIAEYIEAARKVREKNQGIVFLLVGGTDDGNPSCVPSSYLKEQESVRWLDERQDVRELLAVCDLFVLPSYREGVPRTLLEASAMCVPMVSTDTVGCTEVVRDGENGFLVPVKDSDVMAQRILELSESETLRKQMGQKARDIVLEEFDVNIVVDKYLEIYKEFTDAALA